MVKIISVSMSDKKLEHDKNFFESTICHKNALSKTNLERSNVYKLAFPGEYINSAHS